MKERPVKIERIWLAATLLATLPHAAAQASSAPAQPPEWSWPSSADDPELRASILSAGYSPVELRNVRRTLDFLAARNRQQPAERPKWYSKDYETITRGFDGLEKLYGGNGYIPGSTVESGASIPDRKDIADYIIAKGNRVFVSWWIVGHHRGKLFGFPGKGQEMRVRENAMIVFDDDGLITRGTRFLGADLALYTQAGGQTSFPDK